ncbi:hypothetical protein [Butyricicoccus sp. Marseille-Q5471]|uniref:hypothetical protein n=1 Tax=Butyricicoccus sp. Marseille-Q5471 TaxID=3039493 RepID=UPI0024BCD8CF|nr:hypothetical protein [Butyricicoccus sp. Marseille-Q5471]
MYSLGGVPTSFCAYLGQNIKAIEFYQGCTSEQKQAILNQAQSIQLEDQMKAFVDNLPSAAL